MVSFQSARKHLIDQDLAVKYSEIRLNSLVLHISSFFQNKFGIILHMNQIFMNIRQISAVMLLAVTILGVGRGWAAPPPLALYQQAVEDYYAGNINQSMADLKNAIKVYPNFAPFYALAGGVLAGQHSGKVSTAAIRRDMSAALAYYNKALSFDNPPPQYYLLRAYAYHDLKNYSQALSDLNEFQTQAQDIILTQLLEININKIKARGNFAANNYQLAMNAANNVVRLAPADNESYNLRAIINLKLENYPAAQRDLSKALEISPENGIHLFNRAYLNYETAKYSAAKRDLQLAHEKAPQEDYNFFHLRGLIEHELNNFSQAAADFNRAITLNSQKWGLYNDRAILRLDLEDRAGAQADLERARQLAPHNRIVAKNLSLLSRL